MTPAPARHRGRRSRTALGGRQQAPEGRGACCLVRIRARPRRRLSGSRCVERLGATPDFLGYSTEQAEGVITALVRDGAEVAEGRRGR